MTNNLQLQPMFEAWQIGADFRRWCTLGKPMRFGQWFINDHKIEGHQALFYETDSNQAKEYILRMTV